MNEQRKEAIPEKSENHSRIKPNIFHPRRFYLKKLLSLVSWANNSYVKPIAQKQNIQLVDYGCGTKPYLSVFKHDNIAYQGVDIDWNPHADIYIENGRINLPDNSVDVVLSTQVLEHVEDYNQYLKEAYRILKKDGLLLLTTHGYWMYHPDPTDFWRWTSAGLKKIVQDNDFEVVAFKGIIGRASMGLHLFQDGILFKLPKFLRGLWSFFMQFWIMIFDKITSQASRDEDGCTYLVVARKIDK